MAKTKTKKSFLQMILDFFKSIFGFRKSSFEFDSDIEDEKEDDNVVSPAVQEVFGEEKEKSSPVSAASPEELEEQLKSEEPAEAPEQEK